MATGFFGDITKIKYEGPESTNPLAFRHYNPDEIVMGKRMEDHLRFAVAYWHTFVWPGGDPFGGQTFERPWFEDSMKAAKLKADVAFNHPDLRPAFMRPQLVTWKSPTALNQPPQSIFSSVSGLSLGMFQEPGEVATALSEPGAALTLEQRGKLFQATVAPMPFVPHRYHRKQGA